MTQFGEVSHHRLIRPLGLGASSMVFEAEHLLLGDRVAVKICLPMTPRRFQQAFLIEARNSRSWCHPHLMQTYDVGQTTIGLPYLSMRLASHTLAEHLCHRELDAHDVWNITQSIGQGLSYLHSRGLVHCDVKPSNVLLLNNGISNTWCLSDFGLVVSPTDPLRWGAGSFGFAAPEQTCLARPTPQTDIYSFAAVARVVLEVTNKQALRNNVQLQQVLDTAQADQPEHRHQSVAAFLNDLTATLP